MVNKPFPVEFDPVIYTERNADLRKLGEKQLYKHYEKFGKNEGRICSKVASRADFKNLIKPEGKTGLEIGPLDKPLIDAGAYQVERLDYLSQNQLKEKFLESDQVNVEDIVYVDYVWKGEPYEELIRKRFDYVVSSHNIEHSPDLISFLKNISAVLKDNANLFLFIPDKRYCFDHFRSLTNLHEVLFAHLNNHKKPSIYSILEERNQRAHNEAMRHWNGDHGYPQNRLFDEIYQKPLPDLIRDIEVMNTKYNDTHVWQFTPDSFKFIISYLMKNCLIDLELVRLYPTIRGQLEFFAIMRKVKENF